MTSFLELALFANIARLLFFLFMTVLNTESAWNKSIRNKFGTQGNSFANVAAGQTRDNVSVAICRVNCAANRLELDSLN